MSSEEEKREEVQHFLKIISAFRQYEAYSITANNKRRRDFFKLPEDDRKLLEALGWKARLDKVDECIAVNAGVLRVFVENPEIFMDEEDMMYADDGELGEDVHMAHGNSHDHSHNHSHCHSHAHAHPHHPHGDSQRRTTPASPTDMEKIRSTLKQLVRDWSEDGKAERDVCYKPMIDALLAHFPNGSRRGHTRVLIPGAGLARLGWEVANLGFISTCNEYSHFMLLPSFYVLNRMKSLNELTIYPYVHSFSNHSTSAELLRPVQFPDVQPSSLPSGSQFSMLAGAFEGIFGPDSNEDHTGAWDSVMTCFFIDTAKNFVHYLRVIHRILAPDGVWINLGPLLWHWENSDELSIELTLDEVKELARDVGFELSDERYVEAQYSGDSSSMLSYVYNAAFWTATKKQA